MHEAPRLQGLQLSEGSNGFSRRGVDSVEQALLKNTILERNYAACPSSSLGVCTCSQPY